MRAFGNTAQMALISAWDLSIEKKVVLNPGFHSSNLQKYGTYLNEQVQRYKGPSQIQTVAL